MQQPDREPLTAAEAACLRYVELAARPVRDVEVTTVLLAAIWEEIDRDATAAWSAAADALERNVEQLEQLGARLDRASAELAGVATEGADHAAT